MESMKEFSKKYGFNVHSQNGEDGIISEVLKRINLKKGIAVEFGGADGFYCSNTAMLRSRGWEVFMYDLEGNDYVEAKKITPDNVNELPDADVLSIDIDGNDYWIWMAYDKSPEVVVVEINSSFSPDENHVSQEKGASYKAMLLLGISKGYFLLCHTGNLVFVKNEYRELFPEVVGDGVSNSNEYFKTDWL
jgi:hypothetical protein